MGRRISIHLFWIALALSLVPAPARADEKLTREQQEWRAALQRGEIPPRLAEELRIVDPHSPEGLQFQTEIQKIAARLYPNHDFTKEPVRFVLVDEAEPNGFYLKHTKPAVIGLTRGLIRKTAQNADQLASVVGHEMLHWRVAVQSGEGRNTKAEEIYANLEPLRRMEDGGFAAREALALEKALFKREKREGKWDQWKWVLTDHPSGPIAMRSMEAALTDLTVERGRLRTQTTPLSADLLKAVTEAKYLSHIDAELQRSNYASFDRAAKLHKLSELIRTTKPWNEGRLSDLQREIHSVFAIDSAEAQAAMRATLAASELQWDSPSAEALKALKELKHNPFAATGGTALSKAEWEALNTLADTILNHAKNYSEDDKPAAKERARELYGALFGYSKPNPDRYMGREDFPFSPPLGQLRHVRNEYALWTGERDPARSKEHSASIMKAFRANPDATHLWPLDWPVYDLPTAKELEGSSGVAWHRIGWNHLVKIAADDPSGNTRAAMHAFGIHDRRAFQKLDALEYFQLANGPINDMNYDQQVVVRGLRTGSDGPTVSYSSPLGGQFGALGTFLPIDAGTIDTLWARARGGDATALAALKEAAPRAKYWGLTRVAAITEPEWDLPLFLELNASVLRRAGVGVYDGENTAVQQKTIEVFRRLLAADRARYLPTVRKYFLEEIAESGEERYYGRDSGLAYSDPRLRFVALDPDKIFTPEERKSFLEQNLGLPGHSLSGRYGGVVFSYIGMKAPQNAEELMAAAHKLASSPSAFERLLPILAMDDLYTNRAMRGGGRVGPAEFKADFKGLDVIAFLKVVRDGERGFREAHAPLRKLGETEEVMSGELQGALILHLSSGWFESNWPSELGKQVEQWSVMNSYDLFQKFRGAKDDSTRKYDKLADILTQLEKVSDPKRRLELAEQLIFSDHRIEHADLRKKLFRLWERDLRHTYGLDGRVPGVAKRALDTVARIKRETRDADQFELIARLANGVQAQRELAEQLKDEATRVDRQAMLRTQLGGVGAEAISNHLEKDPELGLDTARFLSGPLTNATVKEMHAALERSEKRRRGVDQYGSWHAPSFERVEASLRYNHMNYWSASPAARVLLMNQCLQPPAIDVEKSYPTAREFVFSTILPPDFPNRDLFIEAVDDYLAEVEPYERGFHLANLVASATPAAGKAKPSPWEALAGILMNRGPAEAKIAQALHSHSDTEPALRTALGDAKTKLKSLHRWDVWSLESLLPEALRSQIEHVEMEEGNASFWIVLRIRLKKDSELARQNGGNTEAAMGLLRAYAETRAEAGFETALRWIDRRKDKPYYRYVRDSIDHAKRRAVGESDPETERAQFAEAQRRWGNVTLQHGGTTTALQPVTLLANGKGFKIMSLATGTHFNDLPNSTRDEKKAKHDSAMLQAYLIVADLLSGYLPDEDPHGGQYRIDGRTLHRFDFGGLSHLPLTAAERAVLVETALPALLAHFMGKSQKPIEGLLREAREKYPQHKDFFLRLEATALAAQDAAKELNQKDLLAIVVSAYKNNAIHPDFLAALRKAIPAPIFDRIVASVCQDATIAFTPRSGSAK